MKAIRGALLVAFAILVTGCGPIGVDGAAEKAGPSRPAPPPDEYEPGFEGDRPDDYASRNPMWQASDGEAELQCTGEGTWPWELTAELPPGAPFVDELNQILDEHDAREPLTVLPLVWSAAKDEAGFPMESLHEILVRTPEGRIRLDFRDDDVRDVLNRAGLIPRDATRATDLQKRATRLINDLPEYQLYLTTTLPIEKILDITVPDYEEQECQVEVA